MVKRDEVKLIVAGSRDFVQYEWLCDAIDELRNHFNVTEIVSGTARGADVLGERYAITHDIPVKRFPANWNTYGKSAGYRRNVQMAEYADACLVFRVNNSRGSTHMYNIALDKYGKDKVFLVDI